jgi:hemoglobin-like flavoprotein
MGLNVPLLRSSFDLVIERQPQLTARFYRILFERHPQARALFHRRPLEVQQKMLQEALVAVLDHIEDAAWLSETLRGMGAQHLEYGVTDEMYDWVGASLLTTLSEVAAEDWNDELRDQWGATYGAIAGLMKERGRNAALLAARPQAGPDLRPGAS